MWWTNEEALCRWDVLHPQVEEERDMQVADKDILVFPDQCAADKCSKGMYSPTIISLSKVSNKQTFEYTCSVVFSHQSKRLLDFDCYCFEGSVKKYPVLLSYANQIG